MKLRRTLTASCGLAAAALIVTLTLVGCATDDNGTGGSDNGTEPSPSPSATPAEGSEPFGPGCADVPATGPGSFTAMAKEPVATAASQTPALSTLVTAVTKAGLADTLNNADAITVFAPTNDAFAKIPQSTLASVLADKQVLTNLLTYHVVDQRRTPADLATGTLQTLQGGPITTAKTGDTYTANDARIVCGNLQTRNATVYLIDTVLMPTS